MIRIIFSCVKVSCKWHCALTATAWRCSGILELQARNPVKFIIKNYLFILCPGVIPRLAQKPISEQKVENIPLCRLAGIGINLP